MFDILLKNGKILDPANNLYEKMDLAITKGKISAVDHSIPADKAKETIDCKGLIIIPGCMDMHTHLREPGREDKETIKTGSMAAANGGFTSIACMANTNPVNDNQSVTEFILERAREAGYAAVYPIGAVSRRLEGKELAEIGELLASGCVALSDDGHPILNSELMRRAMEYVKPFNVPIIVHAEDKFLVGNGVMHEGYYSTLLGLPGIPSAAEEVIIARDILLAKHFRTPIHFAHISSKGSVELIRRAKNEGLPITAEVTPHHLRLSDQNLINYDTNFKVNPPLRAEEDIQALIEGINDGTIDVIASDHAPHTLHEKDLDFMEAPFGIIGLDTSLQVILDTLYYKAAISLEKIIAKITLNPNRILHLNGGTLSVGATADITIIDLDHREIVDIKNFKSKSRNCPFIGMELKGKAVMTFLKGKKVNFQ